MHDWIGVGGGNYTTKEELMELGCTEFQVLYLCTLYPTCLRGMVLEKAGMPLHFKCHPADWMMYRGSMLNTFLSYSAEINVGS